MNSENSSWNDDLIRAAEPVRMSTEHQQYSIDNQSEAINLYCREHQMKTVRTRPHSPQPARVETANRRRRKRLPGLRRGRGVRRESFGSIPGC
jgi:hypothetical protein